MIHDIPAELTIIAVAGQTDVAFSFRIFDEGDLLVTVDGIETAEFTVAFDPGFDGGVLSFNVALAVGDVVALYRSLPIERISDFSNTGPVPMETVNTELDRHIAIMQDGERDLALLASQSLRVPFGETIPPLPPASSRAGLLVGFDGAGSPQLVAGTPGPPGGNVMSIGRFVEASGLPISLGTDLVRTSGWHTVGKGSAWYFFDAAVNSPYIAANPRASFMDKFGRGFRLIEDEVASVYTFGAYGDYVTDDFPAFRAALDYAPFGGGYNTSTPPIYVPNGAYKCSKTLEIKKAAHLWGHNGGFGNNFGAVMGFPPGITPFIVHSLNTYGAGTVPDGPSATGTILEGLTLFCDKTGPADAFGGHGIWLRTKAIIRNCGIVRAAGNGIHIVATAGAGGAEEGNANLARIEGGWSVQCGGSPLYIRGADANAMLIQALDCSNGGSVGNADHSFLGNTQVGPHTADNAGGAYLALDPNQRSAFLGAYAESGQPFSQIEPCALVLGGLVGGITGRAGQLHGRGSGIGGGAFAGYPLAAEGGLVIPLTPAADDADAAGKGVTHNMLYRNTTTGQIDTMDL